MQRQNAFHEQLLERYLQGIATPEETTELFAWLRENEPESIRGLEEMIERNYAEAFSQPSCLNGPESERALASILKKINNKKVTKVRFFSSRAAAAVVILLAVGAILHFLFPAQTLPPAKHIAKAPRQVVQAPQSNFAVITLANGNRVSLDSAGRGQLALQGNVRLVKLASGQIAYQDSTKAEGGKLTYNTLTNPRGSQVIDMTLSDGSRVWLNAGSSITYPVAFLTGERRILITGEAYFEVVHDPDKPFYVSKGGMEVEVLGTKFNVDAYDDESSIKITLLEGSVKVSNAIGSVEMKPLEQATLTNNKPPLIMKGADIEQVMAWKNGLFDFDGMSLKEAVPQLEHWYNIDVECEAGMTDVPLFGKIHRNLSLTALLDILRGAGFHFKMEKDRRLVLMK
jgi:ferric-dicitrate binding protein FerR (iron transport regulator)